VEGGAQYQVYLTEELVAAIDGIRGPTSRSAWVRRAIAEKLERDAEAEGPGS
jgi:metal-responsive CopG/Arc/MetJ family transcriptional regulator